MHDTSHSLIPAKLPCLPPSVDWVVSRHEGWPGGGADGLHVVVLQGNPSLHQGVHVGSQDITVVPRDIVEAWDFIFLWFQLHDHHYSGCIPRSSATMSRMLGGFAWIPSNIKDSTKIADAVFIFLVIVHGWQDGNSDYLSRVQAVKNLFLNLSTDALALR